MCAGALVPVGTWIPLSTAVLNTKYNTTHPPNHPPNHPTAVWEPVLGLSVSQWAEAVAAVGMTAIRAVVWLFQLPFRACLQVRGNGYNSSNLVSKDPFETNIDP